MPLSVESLQHHPSPEVAQAAGQLLVAAVYNTDPTTVDAERARAFVQEPDREHYGVFDTTGQLVGAVATRQTVVAPELGPGTFISALAMKDHGKGHGTQALGALAEDAVKRGDQGLYLQPTNERNRALYARLGFRDGSDGMMAASPAVVAEKAEKVLQKRERRERRHRILTLGNRL